MPKYAGFICKVILCLFIWFPIASTAQTISADGARELVRTVLNRAISIQTDPKLAGHENRPQRARLIKELIRENFLLEEMARETLGNLWGRLDPDQQREFTELFQVLFQDSYTRMVLNFLGKERIEFRGQRAKSELAEVYTLIMRPNEHIPVDYELVHREGRWFIKDVRIDGVSIVETYKHAFQRVVSRGSMELLLKKMRLQRKAVEGEQ
jgi:phospholipid transport system substrate-binding protein